MNYSLVPATEADTDWLEQLRRQVYAELFVATFGRWDEERHLRHTQECWERGHIRIIELEGMRVGIIQQFDHADAVEIGEFQIEPTHQNRGIGARVLGDAVRRAHGLGKPATLSVGLKNERALRLYERLGFRWVRNTDTHRILRCDPR